MNLKPGQCQTGTLAHWFMVSVCAPWGSRTSGPRFDGLRQQKRVLSRFRSWESEIEVCGAGTCQHPPGENALLASCCFWGLHPAFEAGLTEFLSTLPLHPFPCACAGGLI